MTTNIKTKFFISIFLLINGLYSQQIMKQQWYLQFNAAQKPVWNEGIGSPRVHTDILGNTFISFSSLSTFEFQGVTDTGHKTHLIKVDKNGQVLWKKLFRVGFEASSGSIVGLCPDNAGGVFATTILGTYFKLSDDSTFKSNSIQIGVINWGSDGEFEKMTVIDNTKPGNLQMGLDGNLYLPRNKETLHIVSQDGKIKTSYFPFYNDFAPHFAANKNGDVASIKGMISGDLFTIGDTTYKAQKSYSYVVVVRDSLGKVKWHKFFVERGFLDIDDNHSLRWDKNNNLYFALNIISSTPGYEKYVANGQKTILYKFDEYGNQIGEFFDTSTNEFSEHYTVTWLQNDEYGEVSAYIYTSSRNDTYYPGLAIKKEDITKYLRLKFNDEFKIQQYYIFNSVPRLDNSNHATKSIFWAINELTPNQSKEYYLPNGQSVTCKYDSDFFVIMMDTTEPKQNSTAKLVQEQVHVSLEPNPLQLNNTLQVHSKLQPIRSVFVLDVKGNKLKEQLRLNTLKTSLLLDQKNGFKAGVYFVRIEFQNGESTTQKIVVTE